MVINPFGTHHVFGSFAVATTPQIETGHGSGNNQDQFPLVDFPGPDGQSSESRARMHANRFEERTILNFSATRLPI